jgi:hypothetical protein
VVTRTINSALFDPLHDLSSIPTDGGSADPNTSRHSSGGFQPQQCGIALPNSESLQISSRQKNFVDPASFSL